MTRLTDLLCEAWKDHMLSDQPWYKRKNVWLMATALVMPFGWVVPVARVAWVRAKRSRRF